jgi:hypothetical protein
MNQWWELIHCPHLTVHSIELFPQLESWSVEWQWKTNFPENSQAAGPCHHTQAIVIFQYVGAHQHANRISSSLSLVVSIRSAHLNQNSNRANRQSATVTEQTILPMKLPFVANNHHSCQQHREQILCLCFPWPRQAMLWQIHCQFPYRISRRVNWFGSQFRTIWGGFTTHSSYFQI